MNYSIKNENLELVVSSHGAEMQSLISKEGISYARDIDQYWNRHAPLLFPIVGKLRDLKTFINGTEYHMNQHGFLRDQEFEVYEQKEDEITFINRYSDETLSMYPFKYCVYVTYKIHNKTVDTIFKVVNDDTKEMIFNYGGHPGFRCPLYNGEKFEDYKIVFEEEENFDAPTVVLENGTLNYDNTIAYRNVKELPLDYKYFEIDAICIPDIKSKSVKLVNKENKGIKFDFQDFPMLAIWTKPNAPFVCLEPWIGHADMYNSNYEFKEKRYLIHLESHNTFKATYSITILD